MSARAIARLASEKSAKQKKRKILPKNENESEHMQASVAISFGRVLVSLYPQRMTGVCLCVVGV